MSATSPQGTNNKAADNRVFVEIPRAKPGQGYKAPRNFDNPLLSVLSRMVVLAACLAMLIVPGVIMAMIMFMPLAAHHNNASQAGLLWLWIPMFVFVEGLALFLCVNVYREAVGTSGEWVRRFSR